MAKTDPKGTEAAKSSSTDDADARAAKAPARKPGEAVKSEDVPRVEREAGMRSPGQSAETAAALQGPGDLRPARPAPRLVYYEGGPCPICGAAVDPQPAQLADDGKPKKLSEDERVSRDYEIHHRVHHAAAAMPVFMREATSSTAQSGAQRGTAIAEEKK